MAKILQTQGAGDRREVKNIKFFADILLLWMALDWNNID
jgi:hypothetical protein